MRTAILRGREHQTIGAMAAIAEACSAVVISRGGARKTYRHTDPNEDAAAFANDEGGAFVAVADGHSGCDASELAIERLLAEQVPAWLQRDAPAPSRGWPVALVDAVVDVHHAIVRHAARAATRAARTTLAFAVVRPADDLLAFAAVGDSHVFRVDAGGAEDVAAAAAAASFQSWLGDPALSPDALQAACTAGRRGLAGTRAVVLATDGISEVGIGLAAPAEGVSESVSRAADVPPELRALTAGRTLTELALAAQRAQRAGDNIATAAVWIGR